MAACGGGSPQASETTSATSVIRYQSTPAVEIEPLELGDLAGPGARFSKLLSRIPSTPSNRRSIWLNDFLPLWDAWMSVGAERPGLEDPADAMDTFFRTVANGMGGGALFVRPRMPAPRVSGFDQIGAIVDTFDFIGFDQRNVDGTAIAGPSGSPIEIAIGDFSSARTAAALAACSECRPPELMRHSGSDFYSWGKDLIGDLSDRFAPPLFDHAGRGGRIAVEDGVAMRALETRRMEMLLDAAGGIAPTIIEDPDFELAAAAHNAAGSYAAWFSNLPFDLQDAAAMATNFVPNLLPSDAVADLLTAAPLVKYDLISMGWGVGSGVPYAVLVLIHTDEAAAQLNAALLSDRFRSAAMPGERKNWSSVIDMAEVGTSGRALVAKLFPHPDQALYDLEPRSFAYGLAIYE